MTKTRHTVEQITSKLREAEVALGKGQTITQVCKKFQITDQTYYRWRIQPMAVPCDDRRPSNSRGLAASRGQARRCRE